MSGIRRLDIDTLDRVTVEAETQEPPATAYESLSAALQQYVIGEASYSLGAGLHDRMSRVQAVVAEQVGNPVSYLNVDPAQTARYGVTKTTSPPDTVRGVQAYFDALNQVLERNPGLASVLPYRSAEEVIGGVRREIERAEQANQDVMARQESLVSMASGFAGTMLGALTDPPVLLSMAFGAGPGQTVLRGMLTEMAVGGLSEAAVQTKVFYDRQAVGAPIPIEQSALNVAAATVGGGALYAGIRGIGAAYAKLVGAPDPWAQIEREIGRELTPEERVEIADQLHQADTVEGTGNPLVDKGEVDANDEHMAAVDRATLQQAEGAPVSIKPVDGDRIAPEFIDASSLVERVNNALQLFAPDDSQVAVANSVLIPELRALSELVNNGAEIGLLRRRIEGAVTRLDRLTAQQRPVAQRMIAADQAALEAAEALAEARAELAEALRADRRLRQAYGNDEPAAARLGEIDEALRTGRLTPSQVLAMQNERAAVSELAARAADLPAKRERANVAKLRRDNAHADAEEARQRYATMMRRIARRLGRIDRIVSDGETVDNVLRDADRMQQGQTVTSALPGRTLDRMARGEEAAAEVEESARPAALARLADDYESTARTLLEEMDDTLLDMPMGTDESPVWAVTSDDFLRDQNAMTIRDRMTELEQERDLIDELIRCTQGNPPRVEGGNDGQAAAGRPAAED